MTVPITVTGAQDLPDLATLIASLEIVPRDGELVEIMELPGHPFFMAVQFHPELKSRPGRPHPLFRDFVAAAVTHQNKGREKSMDQAAN